MKTLLAAQVILSQGEKGRNKNWQRLNYYFIFTLLLWEKMKFIKHNSISTIFILLFFLPKISFEQTIQLVKKGKLECGPNQREYFATRQISKIIY